MSDGAVVADGPTPEILCDAELMGANRLELPYGFDPSFVAGKRTNRTASA